MCDGVIRKKWVKNGGDDFQENMYFHQNYLYLSSDFGTSAP